MDGSGTLRTAREGLCALCYQKASDKCSKCKQRWYCSPQCQLKDWNLGHKGDCGLSDLPQPRVPPPPMRLLPEAVERPVVACSSWRKLMEGADLEPRRGPPRGMLNIGNSCYMNAVLQGLYHAAPQLQVACSEHRISRTCSGPSSGCFRCDLEALCSSSLDPRPAASSDGSSCLPCQFQRGDQVSLFGLARDELNGQDGVIMDSAMCNGNGEDECDGQLDRYQVVLAGQRAAKLVKPENLVLRCRGAVGPQQVARWLPRMQSEFTFGAQEDAHEFLRSLLRLLEDEEVKELAEALRRECSGNGDVRSVPEVNADLTATPSRTFGGLLVSQCTCTNRACGSSSFSFESFMDIALDITEATDSLEDALRFYTSPERLDKKNGWRCESCGETVRARKQLTIYSAPSVVVLQLKRFRTIAVMGGQESRKVTRPISFRSELNLRPFLCAGSPEVNKSLFYELRAVVVHLDKAGYTQFGHYIAYVRCSPPPDLTGSSGGSSNTSSRWYCVDDSQVTEVSEAEVLRQQAYLLMYAASSRGGGAPEAPSLRRHGSGQSASSSSATGTGYPDAANEADFVARTKCRGRGGAMCSFFVAADGFCTRCYQEEHGKSPPPLPTPSASKEPTRSVSGAAAEPTPAARKKSAADSKAATAPTRQAALVATGQKSKKVGANDQCPCGSGRKYKKCHGAA